MQCNITFVSWGPENIMTQYRCCVLLPIYNLKFWTFSFLTTLQAHSAQYWETLKSPNLCKKFFSPCSGALPTLHGSTACFFLGVSIQFILTWSANLPENHAPPMVQWWTVSVYGVCSERADVRNSPFSRPLEHGGARLVLCRKDRRVR